MGLNGRVLQIEERKRARFFVSSPQDFVCSKGESIAAEVVVRNPNVSLYCLDDAQQCALFVELPPNVDLSEPPFYYMEQFQLARRLIAMPYEAVHRLADTLPSEIDRLILIFSTGRCGSTLLSKVFNRLERVVSLSEPDVFTQLVYFRGASRERDGELVALLRSCMRLTCRPSDEGAPPAYVIKFRNQCTQIADLFYAAFPQATYLFLYRNAVDWVASFYRLMLKYGAPGRVETAETLDFLTQYYARPITLDTLRVGTLPDVLHRVESLALSWLVTMERYLALEQSIPFIALRYEDLVADPPRMVRALFERCRMPLDGVTGALAAFDRDAQRGTPLAREEGRRGNPVSLNEDQVGYIQDLLKRHPVIRRPDWVVPDTIGRGRGAKA